jgi:hypothetical protein
LFVILGFSHQITDIHSALLLVESPGALKLAPEIMTPRLAPDAAPASG